MAKKNRKKKDILEEKIRDDLKEPETKEAAVKAAEESETEEAAQETAQAVNEAAQESAAQETPREDAEDLEHVMEEFVTEPGADTLPDADGVLEEEDYLDDPEDDLEFVTEESIKSNRAESTGALSGIYDADDAADVKKKRKRVRRRGPVIVLIVVIIIAALAAFWVFYGRNTDWGSDLKSKIKGFIGKEDQVLSSDEESFAVDEYPEINTLVKKYFDFYAQGDVSKLEVYATPISETEAGYIETYSQYVEDYENITCYTRSGLEEGSWVVCVYMEAKFADVDTLAPGMETFYVRTDEDGSLYIDNTYSQFNMLNQEIAQDEAVSGYIQSIEGSEDMVALQQTTQAAYDKAVASDDALKTMVEETIPNAMADWLNSIGDTAAEEETEAEEETAEEETEEEEQGVTETVQSDTVYATDNVNVRSQPDENAEKVTGVVYGTEISRLAVTDNGWSKVVIDGVSGYIKNDYISTEKPSDADSGETSSEPGSTYFAEGEVIVLNEAFNVRETMSEDGVLMGTAEPGDTVTVILSYAEGWTKVQWDDKIGYIKTSALKTN